MKGLRGTGGRAGAEAERESKDCAAGSASKDKAEV